MSQEMIYKGLVTQKIPPSNYDNTTLSNYGTVSVQHMNIRMLRVDFTSETLTGVVDYTIKAHQNTVQELILDTKALQIEYASVDGEDSAFTVGEEIKPFGKPLTIQLGKVLNQDEECNVTVKYTTTVDSTAVQWLSPEQTGDKQGPFLFTQCQAIHARTMIPCQDTPSVKSTYSANVFVPESLTAVMSAVLVEKSEPHFGARSFKFEQKVPIPAYLIALAVGVLESREIGPRSSVYAEPSVVDSAAWEFAETEKFIAAGEELLGPYVWGRYDILLLPPSFPYGGMENPCLTFATPTLIAKDRSLADVVAHEISHSWTGNLVTSATWEHFWLNEGFTMMVQRKIVAATKGKHLFEFDAINGQFALKDSVDLYGSDHAFTQLVPPLEGIDPDDAFSSVPYEKGFYFLYYLQQSVVRDTALFDQFLHDYIQHHAYKSITSNEFKSYFLEYFASKDVDTSMIEWDRWFYDTGMPDKVVQNQYDHTSHEAIQTLVEAWCHTPMSVPAGATDTWSSSQTVVFLDYLIEQQEKFEQKGQRLAPSLLEAMSKAYGFDHTNNCEIRFRWLKLNLRCGNEAAIAPAIKFLSSQGRMKYVRPLFRDLLRLDASRTQAIEFFESHRHNYHPICSKMVAADITQANSQSAISTTNWERIGEIPSPIEQLPALVSTQQVEPAKDTAETVQETSIVQEVPTAKDTAEIVEEAILQQVPTAQDTAETVTDSHQVTVETVEEESKPETEHSTSDALIESVEEDTKKLEAQRLREEKREQYRREREKRQEELKSVKEDILSYDKVQKRDTEEYDTSSRPNSFIDSIHHRVTSSVDSVGEVTVNESTGNTLSTGIAVVGMAGIAALTVYALRRMFK